VVVTLNGVDRSTVADFAAGIREVPEDEWRDMLADHR
jgi:ribosomal protein L6P/L9E